VEDRIIQETIAYTNKIKETSIYIAYVNLKKELEKNSVLMEQVNQFREESFKIHMEHKYGYFDVYERLLALRKTYQEVLDQELVEDFLQAEGELSKYISNIVDVFTETLAFDLSFIGDR